MPKEFLQQIDKHVNFIPPKLFHEYPLLPERLQENALEDLPTLFSYKAERTLCTP